jgi:hypothetical protein
MNELTRGETRIVLNELQISILLPQVKSENMFDTKKAFYLHNAKGILRINERN